MTINAWGSDDPVEVAKGGTGAGTHTDNSVLLGSGTSPVTSTAALTDGQLLIGDTGSAPVEATFTATTNETTVATGAGSTTVGLADDAIVPGTEGITAPGGTTAQRPGSPTVGMTRYNSSNLQAEGRIASEWVPFGSSGGAGAWVFLASGSASIASSLTFNSTDFDSSYTDFVVFVDNFLPQSSTTDLVNHNITPSPSGNAGMALYSSSSTTTRAAYTGSFCSVVGALGQLLVNVPSSWFLYISNYNTPSVLPTGYLVGCGVGGAYAIQSAGSATGTVTATGLTIARSSGNNFSCDAYLYGITTS